MGYREPSAADLIQASKDKEVHRLKLKIARLQRELRKLKQFTQKVN
jgi:hypothetical protein